MTSTLVSSVPGVYERFCVLVSEACQEQEKQTAFFDFALNQYEPSQYVIVEGIEGPEVEWEGIGTYEQKEKYRIYGFCTIFTGDSPVTSDGQSSGVALRVLVETYALLNQTVMAPMFTYGRNEPILGTEGPSPYLMLPERVQYVAGPGDVDGQAAGWESQLKFAFRFEAILTPGSE